MDLSEPEFIIHIARLYHRGIICPTEAWQTIAEANRDVVRLLDSLKPIEQELIRRIHDDRPESLLGLANRASRDEGFKAMLSWCRNNE